MFEDLYVSLLNKLDDEELTRELDKLDLKKLIFIYPKLDKKPYALWRIYKCIMDTKIIYSDIWDYFVEKGVCVDFIQEYVHPSNYVEYLNMFKTPDVIFIDMVNAFYDQISKEDYLQLIVDWSDMRNKNKPSTGDDNSEPPTYITKKGFKENLITDEL